MTAPAAQNGAIRYRLHSPADTLNTTVPRGNGGAPSDGEDDADEQDRLGIIQQTFQREYQDARDYIDSDIGPERATATSYYLGATMETPIVGRSAVIDRAVRDTVIDYLPSVMRVLFGMENVVEYVPNRPDSVAQAEQVTDFVNLVVVRQDNDGFLETYAAVKDALVRKAGFLKWWWDESVSYTTTHCTGLDEEALQVLANDPEVQNLDVTKDDRDPMRVVYNAVVNRKRTTGRVRFCSVAPEEVLINREASSFRDARAVFHRRVMLVNELVAMGFLLEDVLQYAQATSSLNGNMERLARNPYQDNFGTVGTTDLLQQVLYVEGYILVQPEGAPIATLHKVCSAGEQGGVLRRTDGSPAVYEWDHVPFAALSPDPEPHTFFGTCPADMAMDVQDIRGAVQRGMLDSLSLAINPRTEVVEGQVNLHDLMNPEINRIIRVRAPGMIQEKTTPFLGGDALPVLGYYDQVLQQRTKQNDMSKGLDGDALQSTSRQGVRATLDAAQGQQELTARLFAEGGIRDLYRGILRLLVQHQDEPRMVRLRGAWVQIDPRAWDAEMDVAVTVALGQGTREDKVIALQGIKAAQELIFQSQGNDNILVSPAQYRTTLAKLTELGGFRDPGMFFKPIDPNYQPPPPPPPEPSDAERLERVQMAELDLRANVEAAKITSDMQQAQMKDATDRFKAVLASQTSVKQGEARAGMTFAQAQLEADIKMAGQIAAANSAERLAQLKGEQETLLRAMDHGSAVHLATLTQKDDDAGEDE